jgi:hypothetical protein
MSIRFDVFLKRAARGLASFFKTRAVIKLLFLILILTGLVRLIRWIPTLQVRRSPMPEIVLSSPAVSLGEIPRDAGLTLAAANGSRKLYVDPASMNIIVEDEETGFIWKALRGEEGTPEERSLIRIVFISGDDVISRWDSYTYSAKEGGYTLERIADGVRVNLHIGNPDPTDINAFMPRRISIERYEETFPGGLDRKFEEGIITGAEAGRYRDVLGLIYAKDEANGWYYNKLSASPPGSATRQMLTMTRLLDYTAEMLIEDEAPYDLPSEDRRPPAGFFIPLEFALDQGDLTARVCTRDIIVENDYYTLTQIVMLPNFGSVSAAECPSGYMFVPDGSGALVALNSFDANYNGYERPLYNNTVFRDKSVMPQFPEDLSMPVFGISYGESGGFMGIIETGDETAFIGVRAGSAQTGSSGAVYNRVYSGFDTSQFQQLSIAGAETNGGSYTVGTGMLDMDFSVRYKFASGPFSYFDMAVSYRSYLAEKYGLIPDYSVPPPRLFLDVTGAVTVEGRILGKAYRRTVSMTGYAELAEILADMDGIRKTVIYNGVFNGGLDNSLSNRAVLVPQIGTRQELAALMEAADRDGAEIFWGTNIARIAYTPGIRTAVNGYDIRVHAAQGYNSEPAFFWGYSVPERARKNMSSWYTQLNPLYLPNVIEGFLADAGPYRSLYLNDLGSGCYASYKRNALVLPRAARIITDRGLSRLGEGKTLALNNPSINKLALAAYAVNISRESSNYGGFYASVPFRQLVMNGFTAYTTLDANMSGESFDYYLLQALELGSIPKFKITARSADPLKYTEHTEFLATRYTALRDRIKSFYERYTREAGRINSARIAGHQTLGDKVFTAIYTNGVRVTVNYNRFPVDAGAAGIIPPMGYVIQERDQ